MATWKARRKRKGKANMNPSLLQRPTKVKPNTNVKYIYAPSVLTEGCKLEPGTIIKVLEVHKGKTKDETMLKVVDEAVWSDHIWRVHRQQTGFKIEDCNCRKPIDEMEESTDKLKDSVFFVLLSDIGK